MSCDGPVGKESVRGGFGGSGDGAFGYLLARSVEREEGAREGDMVGRHGVRVVVKSCEVKCEWVEEKGPPRLAYISVKGKIDLTMCLFVVPWCQRLYEV